MANVTDGQRKAFFAFVSQPGVGLNRARKLMRVVTKGITSLCDPKMTPWKMSMVLKTFSHYFGPGLEVKKGAKTITLRTKEQKEEILRLRNLLGWADEKYHSLCRLVLGRDEPLSQDEAARVIFEMQKLLVKR